MVHVSRRHFLALTGASGGAYLGAQWLGTGEAHARPLSGTQPPPTIPALQSWEAAAGRFTLRPDSRITVPNSDKQLRATAEVLAEDLYLATGHRIRVTERRGNHNGDIHLLGASSSELGEEGYDLRVGESIEISGSEAGVFWGTRTLVQWFRQTTTVPRGVARDWPDYPERGLLVCNTPKHFSMSWWQSQIRELSYLKLNLLWIYVGYDTTPLDEMAAIARFAERYNVTVVPQLNMPGHMEKLLFEHPAMALPGRIESLDLSNPEAYSFAERLMEPLLDEFDTPYWHAGADEYMLGSDYANFPQLAAYARQLYGSNAVPDDLQNGFLNRINKIVRGHGKTLRIWNDGLLTDQTVAVDQNVIIEHWYQRPGAKSAQQLIDEGYRLSNSNQDYLYYDPGFRRPDPENLYDHFQVGLFSGDTRVADENPALLGAKISLWTLPNVETAHQESDGLAAPLRALAQVLWGSPRIAPTYAEFEPLVTVLGRAPGFPAIRIEPSPLDGAGSVSPTAEPSVQFYDEVRPESIRFVVRGRHGNRVNGSTSFDATSRTATFKPAQPLDWSTDYTVDVDAEPTRESRSAREPLRWQFRTSRAPGSRSVQSIWQDTDSPALDSANDSHAVELGIRFLADVDGTVEGIRFYKGPSNVGRHFGRLWSSDGVRLASAMFADESTVGWQEVRFSEPVRIEANKAYVASYYAQVGGYAATSGAFAGAGRVSGNLHALPSDESAPNGLFGYGAGDFPTESYLATNYWVDVLFNPRG